jgi:hypothetical protein
MFKETLTYTNYNDEEVTEDVYFNLSKAELLEMHFQAKGGLDNYIQSILNARDIPTLAKLFKELLLKSYGIKDPEGRKFIKSEEIRKDFECSIPFEILYTRYSTDAKAAANFINGIMPADLRKAIEDQGLLAEVK